MARVKKGDNVVVLSGKDRGKQGKVLRVMPKDSKVLVEGIALAKKRRGPRKQGEKGQTLSLPMPINLSNVSPYCGKCKKGVRVGHEGAGKSKTRVCAKCKSKI